jgi:hypothetical protein
VPDYARKVHIQGKAVSGMALIHLVFTAAQAFDSFNWDNCEECLFMLI